MYVFFLVLCFAGWAAAQPAPQAVRLKIQAFKEDPRGPFQGIRWFCPDGSVRPANSPCGVPGGRQQALHKDWVQALADSHGIFLGQILSGTDPADFWDAGNDHSRLKQYQLERFLQNADDGWILRRARFYRGAAQAEGEEDWSRRFLLWLAAQDDMLDSRFFLVRQAVRDLPRGAGQAQNDRIRAVAKTLADSLPAFIELKNKIHGRPDAQDAERVAAFVRGQTALTPSMRARLDSLQSDIRIVYGNVQPQRLSAYLDRLSAASPVLPLVRELSGPQAGDGSYALLAELLWRIRDTIADEEDPQTRLALLELSLDAEELLFRGFSSWEAGTTIQLLGQNYVLARAAAGAGLIEMWEWKYIENALTPPVYKRHMALADFIATVERARRALAWGTATVAAQYDATVERHAAFEPLARGFIDDRIRASLLLPWGETVARLGDLAAERAGTPNQFPAGRGQARGLNPGFALGPLEVLRGGAEETQFRGEKIYFLERAPADLGPVAGIATVSEGNAVSHVQLLARNLGIPNAVVGSDLLTALAPYSGGEMFYAVSPRGRVILKASAGMSPEEEALFARRQRPEERLWVPTERLDLEINHTLPLADLRAADSGRLCGPKAANLGQLGALFPGRVAPGLAIPFGIFRRHFDQPMPGTEGSYWDFVKATFYRAEAQRLDGLAEIEVETWVLTRLGQLRQAVEEMPFLPDFLAELDERFVLVFGASSDETAVFVRSDTNMEDLKDFTGAGLNLTVPNARGRQALLQAVRRVWASPYTERSYRWRQKYLLNPEDVYPSVLLQQSVSLDKSGVLITAGVSVGDSLDLTVAFSRGVGGAVEGQAAESYLLRRDGTDVLLAPAREPSYTVLPAEGGTRKQWTGFERPLLSAEDRRQLRLVAAQIRQRLPQAPGIGSAGPYDVELGFVDDHLRLFQARPFVENKRAQSTLYLRALDPPLPTGVWIDLNKRLERNDG